MFKMMLPSGWWAVNSALAKINEFLLIPEQEAALLLSSCVLWVSQAVYAALNIASTSDFPQPHQTSPICCSGSPSGEFCCLRYWLGVPLHCTSYTSALNATAQQTGCGGNGDRIARHNAICDVLYSLWLLVPRLSCQFSIYNVSSIWIYPTEMATRFCKLWEPLSLLGNCHTSIRLRLSDQKFNLNSAFYK